MIYQLLINQKDFQNPIKYQVKFIQFIAIVNDPSLSKSLIKKFTINNKGLINLGYEEIDEQIKSCLSLSGIIKTNQDELAA
ncbi:hypothetical protein [Candidatus Trichorickettsia mobilis]|uniref:hypothetical protein n=1 Tax=Candidatus Trichorickettsia mobilis TaxID=1346319 RepID=UPI00292E345F|nr:hypothetical protein [Candidatus Trichorickettsia mobilis]